MSHIAVYKRISTKRIFKKRANALMIAQVEEEPAGYPGPLKSARKLQSDDPEAALFSMPSCS